MNTWHITLPQEIADFVNEQLARNAWDKPDMLFAAAVSGLQSTMALQDSMDKDWLRTQIRVGVEEAERGELFDADEVFDEILKDLREQIERAPRDGH